MVFTTQRLNYSNLIPRFVVTSKDTSLTNFEEDEDSPDEDLALDYGDSNDLDYEESGNSTDPADSSSTSNAENIFERLNRRYGYNS